ERCPSRPETVATGWQRQCARGDQIGQRRDTYLPDDLVSIGGVRPSESDFADRGIFDRTDLALPDIEIEKVLSCCRGQGGSGKEWLAFDAAIAVDRDVIVRGQHRAALEALTPGDVG